MDDVGVKSTACFVGSMTSKHVLRACTCERVFRHQKSNKACFLLGTSITQWSTTYTLKAVTFDHDVELIDIEGRSKNKYKVLLKLQQNLPFSFELQCMQNGWFLLPQIP